MTNRTTTQLVIIGGSPAGSAAATLLAHQGIRVELLFKDELDKMLESIGVIRNEMTTS